MQTPARPPSTAVALVGVLALVEAATFGIAALLHLGLRIPLGFAVLAEPPILPAAIVESLCGLALAIGGYAILTHRSWAWWAATTAHSLAIAGVLLGMVALAAGRGPRTESNDIYHRVMLVALVGGLLLLASPGVRRSLRRWQAPA